VGPDTEKEQEPMDCFTDRKVCRTGKKITSLVIDFYRIYKFNRTHLTPEDVSLFILLPIHISNCFDTRLLQAMQLALQILFSESDKLHSLHCYKSHSVTIILTHCLHCTKILSQCPCIHYKKRKNVHIPLTICSISLITLRCSATSVVRISSCIKSSAVA